MSTQLNDRYSLGTGKVYRAVNRSVSRRRCGDHQAKASEREPRHRRRDAARGICTDRRVDVKMELMWSLQLML